MKLTVKKIFNSFTYLTRSKVLLKGFSYSDFKHADDLNFISMDLIYAIAVMEILHPHANNAVKEGGTYHQSSADHLYLRYANYALQTVYSFWDRIGDFLDFFFDTKQKGDVYLSRVLHQFPQEHWTTIYDHLVDLYKTHVLPVLELRHSAVHTFTLKARYFWGVMEHGRKDMEKLEALQAEKDAYPHIFREQLQYMFKGFELAMNLIAELPDKPLPEEAIAQ
jgi:hypothetical protein